MKPEELKSKPMKTPGICPVCKGKNINKKPKKTWAIGYKTYVQIWKCKDCGKDERHLESSHPFLELPKPKKAKKKKSK